MKRVLIVDDDPDVLASLALLLAGQYEIDTAPDGLEALRCLEHFDADAIVLDLMMPVMDGWQFRKHQLQDKRFARIPTIIVSAAGRDRMAQVEADAYLAKPIDMDELLSRVAEFCKA